MKLIIQAYAHLHWILSLQGPTLIEVWVQEIAHSFKSVEPFFLFPGPFGTCSTPTPGCWYLWEIFVEGKELMPLEIKGWYQLHKVWWRHVWWVTSDEALLLGSWDWYFYFNFQRAISVNFIKNGVFSFSEGLWKFFFFFQTPHHCFLFH